VVLVAAVLVLIQNQLAVLVELLAHHAKVILVVAVVKVWDLAVVVAAAQVLLVHLQVQAMVEPVEQVVQILLQVLL
jgi:hypothetical protein